MNLSSAITKLRVTITTKCRLLTYCIEVSNAFYRERASILYRVYSVSGDNLLMWMCEVQFLYIMGRDSFTKSHIFWDIT
jgi:hypothetical protein